MKVLRASRRFQAALDEADLGWRNELEPGVVWSIDTQGQCKDIAGLGISIDITGALDVDESEVGRFSRELHRVQRLVHLTSCLVMDRHLEALCGLRVFGILDLPDGEAERGVREVLRIEAIRDHQVELFLVSEPFCFKSA